MATLKSLVDETTNIKNELVECYTNLKNNLITKGIDVGSFDKLSALVGKIKDIAVVQITVGDSVSLYKDPRTYSLSKVTEYTYFPAEYIFMSDGDYRLSVAYKSNGSFNAYVKFVILDENDLMVYEEEFFNKDTSYLTVITDVTNVKKGYKFKVMGKTDSSSSGLVYIDGTSVLCNLEWR